MKTIKLEIEIPENKLDFFLELFRNLKPSIKVSEESGVFSKEEFEAMVKEAREDYEAGKTHSLSEEFENELRDGLSD